MVELLVGAGIALVNLVLGVILGVLITLKSQNNQGDDYQ